MSEWSGSLLSRVLLRSLSAVLTVCLLIQFFISGMAAMTNPEWWSYHSAWVGLFQWLVVPLPILAWFAGTPRRWRTVVATLPLLQIAAQYILAHRAVEGRLGIGLGLHALDAALMLLVVAALAMGLLD